MRIIFLIIIGVSSLMAGNFTRNANGVVTDSRTNLEWQDDYSNNIKEATWQSAIDYCENLNLDANSDWRLPNLNELTSLVDDTKYTPAINPTFVNTNSNYWSSTSVVNNSNDAWVVYFDYGNQGNDGNKDNNSYYVRCVRAGQ